jgi:hypothetical protein
MSGEELRPEIVAALTARPRLSGDRQDALLDANLAEREVAARILLDQSRELLEQAGALPRQGTVLDLDLRTATALAGAYAALQQTGGRPGTPASGSGPSSSSSAPTRRSSPRGGWHGAGWSSTTRPRRPRT